MKKLLLSPFVIFTLLVSAQQTARTPFGETAVLYSVDSLGVSPDSATYEAICAAAALRGYELWPTTTTPDDFINSLQTVLGSGNAYLATNGPVREDGQEFLYKLSYKTVAEFDTRYTTLKHEYFGFVDTSIYPGSQRFLFKKR